MNSSLSSVLNFTLALVLAAVLGCGPDDGNKAFEQGQAAYELRDLNKAAKFFAESVKAKPQDTDRLLYLARVKLDLGEIPEAKDLVARAALNAQGDPDVGLLEAQIAWHLKDYKAAASDFTAIAEDAKLDAALRAQAWAGLGVVEMTCNNGHLARIAFLRSIRLDRMNAAARYHLALLYRDVFGYPEMALEQFEIFIRLEKDASPRVQKVQRSLIPALKESIAHAAAERPGASKRNSGVCASAIAKAEAAMKKGNFKTARAAYQEALEADPLSYPAALGLARAWEKGDATKSGQSKALDYYQMACSLSPSAISTFLVAGSLAARLGLHAQAAAIYSRAVAAAPTSFDALDGLIRSLQKSGKAKIAQAYQKYRESIPVRKK